MFERPGDRFGSGAFDVQDIVTSLLSDVCRVSSMKSNQGSRVQGSDRSRQ